VTDKPTELGCVLRYKPHYHMASGIHAYDLSSMLATFDPEKTSTFKYALSAFFSEIVQYWTVIYSRLANHG